MEKRIYIFLILIIVLITGCSQQNTPKKTEEELREEIKKEIEAEEKLKEELREEIKAEMEDKELSEGEKQKQSEPSSFDVRDADAVFEFISNSYPDKYTKEDFDKWTPYYFDITKDGNDEVIFTTTYGDGNLEYALFITADNGGYKIIPSKIGLVKYENSVDYKDGFLLISQKTGGSGAFITSLGIYVYDGKEIKYTGVDIVTEDVASFQNGYCITGELKGNLADFIYVATKEDYASGKNSLVEKTRYVYDSKTMKYNIEPLLEDKESDSHSTALDITLSVKDFIGKYPPANIETKEDGGYVMYSTSLTYDNGLRVFVFHDEKDYNTGDIASIIITDSKYCISGLDVKIGMSLQDAYNYCDENFDNLYNHHDDVYMDEMYLYKGFVLHFNDRDFGEKPPVTSDDRVEKIGLYIPMD